MVGAIRAVLSYTDSEEFPVRSARCATIFPSFSKALTYDSEEKWGFRCGEGAVGFELRGIISISISGP